MDAFSEKPKAFLISAYVSSGETTLDISNDGLVSIMTFAAFCIALSSSRFHMTILVSS